MLCEIYTFYMERTRFLWFAQVLREMYMFYIKCKRFIWIVLREMQMFYSVLCGLHRCCVKCICFVCTHEFYAICTCAAWNVCVLYEVQWFYTICTGAIWNVYVLCEFLRCCLKYIRFLWNTCVCYDFHNCCVKCTCLIWIAKVHVRNAFYVICTSAVWNVYVLYEYINFIWFARVLYEMYMFFVWDAYVCVICTGPHEMHMF